MQMTLCKAQGSSPQQGTLRAFRRQLPLCEKLDSLLELRHWDPSRRAPSSRESPGIGSIINSALLL